MEPNKYCCICDKFYITYRKTCIKCGVSLSNVKQVIRGVILRRMSDNDIFSDLTTFVPKERPKDWIGYVNPYVFKDISRNNTIMVRSQQAINSIPSYPQRKVALSALKNIPPIG